MIEEIKAETGLSVQRICQVLQASRSGYYSYVKRRENPKPTGHLAETVQRVFTRTHKAYGSRRMMHALRAEGVKIGRFKIRSIMKKQGLTPTWKRRFVRTTDSDHDLSIAPNKVNRDFNPPAPNRVWVTDISYVKTLVGWAYLAVVMDLFARRVVGWAVDSRMPAGLACEALKMAIAQRQPPSGLVVHSDRGSQFASAEFTDLLGRHGLIASMSRKGDCWDNAVMERFFLTIKTERLWQRNYANCSEVRRDVTDYIVGFYNLRRLNSTLGYKTPVHYEAAMAS